MSFRTRIDEENCVALTPNGKTSDDIISCLLLCSSDHGRPEPPAHSFVSVSSAVVEVDLMDRSMAPGGRAYLRLLKALRCHLNLRTDFLISHHAGEEQNPGSEPLLSRYDWSERRPEVCRRALRDLLCPDLRSCDPHSLLEWLGAVDAGCGNSSSTFLSSLVCPEPQRSLSGALSVSLCGLLRPQDVWRLVEQLRSQAEEDSWASVTVHGFTDSPVSWGEEEHGVLTGGETFYNLLMFQDHAYRLHLATGPQDACPP
uniref:Ribonuclease P/MRP 40 subunit n=1 Tax=Cyprinodon variegatus TaxID=28743 RepID=A0A3Q2CWB1_CYPVA